MEPVCGPHIQKARQIRLYNILSLPDEVKPAYGTQLQYRGVCHLS